MLGQLLLGGLIGISTAIHAVATSGVMEMLRGLHAERVATHLSRILLLVMLVIAMCLAAFLEAALWALVSRIEGSTSRAPRTART